MMRVGLVALVLLAACGDRPQDAPSGPDWHPDGPPALTLYTQRGGVSGRGAHSALLITGTTQVLLDPAGTFGGNGIAVQNDVILNVTPGVLTLWHAYQARQDYYLVAQTVEVAPDVAAAALDRALALPDMAPGTCTHNVADLLATLPGMTAMADALFPDILMARFATLPGVTETRLEEDDFTIPARVRASYNTRFDEACLIAE